MKIGVMQPYAFPYIGYFQLINYVEKWVVFDGAQYISKGWINRNRILHPDRSKEWQYVTIPTRKHSHTDKICDIKINNDIKWRDQFLGKLTAYKRKAPFYVQTIDLIKECLTYESVSLSNWVTNSLVLSCQRLGIAFDYSMFSSMNIDTSDVREPGDWALKIACEAGADEYVNPYGGYSIFSEEKFIERGVSLKFLKPELSSYVQRRGEFVEGLSIIDVMMWVDTAGILEILGEHKVMTWAMLDHNEVAG